MTDLPSQAISAPELIMSLVDSAANPALSANYFITAGQLFDIEPQTTRVALTRLAKKGVLEQHRRGYYGVGTAGGSLHSAVRGWQHVEEGLEPWTGRWVAVYIAHLEKGRTAVRRRERALRLSGFAAADTGLWIRPANLTGSTAALRGRLIDLGLDEAAMVVLLAEVLPASSINPTALWDTRALEHLYRAHSTALEVSTARLERLAPEDAARETLLLGRQVTHDILLDPLLPDAMVDTDLRRNMIAAMRAYDRIGKSCWRAFYKRHG